MTKDEIIEYLYENHTHADFKIEEMAEDLAEPVRMNGKWIYGENDCQDGWFCSECRFFIPWYYDYYGLNNINFIKDFHVCPHCKAEMVTYTGKKEDTDEHSG